MAPKKQTKATKTRMGRPTKSESGATVAQVSVRLTEDDLKLLETIREEEQARADEHGLLLRISPADVFRILLRNRGRETETPVAKAS